MSGNVTEAFTKNSFVDKITRMIPEDPVTQTQYIYYLTVFVFFGLLGYAGVSWYTFFTTFKLSSFFSGIFMLAVALISAFGLKQTRTAYQTTKAIYSQTPKNVKIEDTIESPDKMKEMFK